MIVNESGLCRIMTESYRRGYEIIPQPEVGYTTLFGSQWAVRMPSADIPRKVLGLIAQHAGCIPEEPIKVQKNTPNQLVMPETALSRLDLLGGRTRCRGIAKQIPVIFKGEWQLYVFADGEPFAVSVKLLCLLEGGMRVARPLVQEIGGLLLGMWSQDDWEVYIAPGHHKGADGEQVASIAAIYADVPEQDEEDEPEEAADPGPVWTMEDWANAMAQAREDGPEAPTSEAGPGVAPPPEESPSPGESGEETEREGGKEETS